MVGNNTIPFRMTTFSYYQAFHQALSEKKIWFGKRYRKSDFPLYTVRGSIN